MKKIFCILVCLLFGVSSAVVVATEKEYNTYENFIIEETEDAVIIKGCVDATVTEIYVPGYINGKKVEIAEDAFLGVWGLESIVFSEGITYLPKDVGYRLSKLKKVVIPESVREIGDMAFWESGIEEIDLKNVEIIGSYSFSGCDNLIRVIHSGNLKEIKQGAFNNCTKLSSIDLTSVEVMQSRVFVNCNSLEYINIEKLNEWAGLSNEDVNRETKRVKTNGVYNRDPRRQIKPSEAWTSFESLSGLKTIRINLNEVGTSELKKAMFSDCPNIETVIFESFIRPGDWEFYITEGIAYLKLKKLPEKMTIYGRGDEVRLYAESLGVPFKELIDVNLNSERIWMDDSLPYIKNDRTMVPMRAIFEALGAEVSWDDSTKTAIGVKNDVEVKITIGENVLYKNGEAIELDALAEIAKDRTMVPVRAIGEAFGCTVNWNDETKTVEIINKFFAE